jgi:hypothetical protein
MRADLSKIFMLGEAYKRGAVRADLTCDLSSIEKWMSGQCDPAITLRQDEGRKYYHLVGTTYACAYLISKKIQHVFREEAIVGWTACPVEFVDKGGRIIEDYDLLGITGKSGKIDNSRSTIIETKTIPGEGTNNILLGYYFSEDSWDGSDIFRPEGVRGIMCTERVKNIVEAMEGETNIEFEPILESKRYVFS